jgi:autophagy-related protein 18
VPITSLVEMLYSTSLLAVVGAGAQPALSQRRLSVLNTAEQARPRGRS